MVDLVDSGANDNDRTGPIEVYSAGVLEVSQTLNAGAGVVITAEKPHKLFLAQLSLAKKGVAGLSMLAASVSTSKV